MLLTVAIYYINMNIENMPLNWQDVFNCPRDNIIVHGMSATKKTWRSKYINRMKFVIMISDDIICSNLHGDWYCLKFTMPYSVSSYMVYMSDTFHNLLRISFTEYDLSHRIPIELQNINAEFPEIQRIIHNLYTKNRIDIYCDNYYGYQLSRSTIFEYRTKILMRSIRSVCKFNINNCRCKEYPLYINDLPIEIICTISEFLSLNDMANICTINKYYYLWSKKEIKKRMNENNIASILSSVDSVCLYYGFCHFSGKYLSYQYVGNDCVLCFQTDHRIDVAIFHLDRIICTGFIDIDLSIDVNDGHKLVDICYEDNSILDNFGKMLHIDTQFTIGKDNNLYVKSCHVADEKNISDAKYERHLYYICKLSEKMMRIIDKLKYLLDY